MGSSERSKSVSNLVPGPGQYNINTRIGNAPKYSMASKSGAVDMSKYVVSPGPCGYSPNYKVTIKSNGSYTMSPRHQSKSGFNTPGPGNYTVRSDKSLIVPSYK
jgi:hypothetical protein